MHLVSPGADEADNTGGVDMKCTEYTLKKAETAREAIRTCNVIVDGVVAGRVDTCAGRIQAYFGPLRHRVFRAYSTRGDRIESVRDTAMDGDFFKRHSAADAVAREYASPGRR